MTSLPHDPLPGAREFARLGVIMMVAGLVALAASWIAMPPVWSIELALVVIAAILFESYPALLGGFSVSVSLTLTMTALLLAGPTAAGIVAVSSSVTLKELRSDRPLYVHAYNSGQLLLSACASGWLYIMLGGPLLSTGPGTFHPLVVGDLSAAIPALLVVAIVAPLLNIAFVGAGNTVYRGDSFWGTIRPIVGMLPGEVALGLAGYLLAQVLAIIAESRPALIVFVLLSLGLLDFARRWLQMKSESSAAEERERVARDAHDRVYNRLAALATRLETEAEGMGGSAPIETAASEIRTAVTDLQRIIRPDAIRVSAVPDSSVQPLIEAVRDVCESQASRYGYSVSCVGLDALANVPAEQGWDIECIVEEALSNAAKHGHASNVVVTFGRGADGLLIEVADNGDGVPAGFSVEDALPGSTGLRGMVKRVESHSGCVRISPANPGTVLTVELGR